MADSWITNYLKRLGAYLTLKLSNLFYLNSRCVGTVAGLAIAMVLTWRLLRTPSATRRPKRNLGTATSGANAASSGSSTLEDSKPQHLVDHFFQSAKVTCRLLGVILEESSPEEIQKQATVRPSVLNVLLEITKFCDLYLMDRILDDESREKVLSALEEAGIFTSGSLVKEKVLFCSTENGRVSFVRQLEPDWHIDSNPDIVFQLARFIRYQLYISPNKLERTASNVFCSPSLEQFFGLLNRN